MIESIITMKSISVSDDLHRRLMNAKTSTLKSADAVIEKLVMPNDNDLIDTMNRMNNPFTCFNCGAECDSLLDGSSDVVMAVLHFDNGSTGSREQPPEPASFYFECIECYEKSKKKEE